MAQMGPESGDMCRFFSFQKMTDSIIISLPLQLARGASRRSRRPQGDSSPPDSGTTCSDPTLPSFPINEHQTDGPAVRGRRGAVRPSGCLAVSVWGLPVCLSVWLGGLAGWLAGSGVCLAGSSLHLESTTTGGL